MRDPRTHEPTHEEITLTVEALCRNLNYTDLVKVWNLASDLAMASKGYLNDTGNNTPLPIDKESREGIE